MKRRLLLVSSVFAFSLACATSRPVADSSAQVEVVDPEAWRATAPSPGEPPELVTPRFQQKVLENGLTVLVSERHDLPVVSVNVALSAGSASDPRGKEGLARLTYETLLEGAGKLDAVGLDEAFGALGSSPFVSVGQDGALVGTQVLTRNLDAATSLLADIIQKPTFAKASFERRQQQQMANLAQAAGSPGFLASEAFVEVAFGAGHPYGRLGSGTPASVSGLQLADARKFWADHAGAKAAAFIVTGDVTMEQAEQLARAHFGKWKGAGKAPMAPGVPNEAPRENVVFVPKQGLAQTLIVMGGPSIAAGHPDEFALDLASTVFGGFFGSRLNMNLREDKGYTYGARARVEPRLGIGPLTATSSVRSDVTGLALAEFIHELKGIQSRPITSAELEAAREGLIRSVPGSFENVGGLASAAANLFWTRQPLDRYAKMVEGYEKADAAAVQAAAEKYFDPARLHIVLVGDPGVIGEQVPALGLGTLIERNVVQQAAAKR